MKTKNQNRVIVGGNVKISTLRGKRKIKSQVAKNSAEEALFSFLTHALNDQRIENYLPKYLRIITKSAAGQQHSVVVSKQQTNLQDSSKITFGFFVAYNQLGTSGSTQQWSVTKLQLCGQKADILLAEVQLTQPFEGIVPNNIGYSLLVDWTIGFRDASSKTEANQA